jgi:hypothetical protein
MMTPEPADQKLTLSDLGASPKLGLKGAGAEAWLRTQNVDIPPATYDTRPLPDGGLIARFFWKLALRATCFLV